MIFHASNELRPAIAFASRVLYFVASLLPKKPTKVLKHHDKNFLTLLLAFGTLGISGWAISAEPLSNKAIFDDGYPEQAPIESMTLSFEKLGLSKFKLDGVSNSTRVDFTNCLDKLGKN